MKKFIKKYKNILNIIVLILITGLVLYFSLKDDFEAIVARIVNINIGFLLLAFFMIIVYWLLRSLALHKFTKKFKKDNKYTSSLQCMLRTQFFNAITPFSTGGQPYQIYYLTRSGVSPTLATNIIIQNFIVYQIALVFLGIVAVLANFFFHILNEVSLLQHLVLIGFLANTLVIIILFIVSFSKSLNKKLISLGITILTKLHLVKDKEKKLQEWYEYINKFHAGAKVLLTDKWEFGKTIIYNVVALSCLYAIPVVLLYSMGDFTSYNVLIAIVTSAYVMLIGSFVPIPGASGGLEYGFISFYGNFIGGAKLKAIMLLWRFVTYYFGLIVGSIALNIKRVK